MIQGIFFVFGVFALLGLSFICQPQREFRFGKILGSIILWSLINVFIHSFSFSLTSSFATSFINYCLLSEGFIYTLCGSLLFYLVTVYRKNLNIVYPILVINILNLIFAASQRLGVHWIWSNNPSISGILGQCTQFALFSALSIPILMHYKKIFALIPILCLAMYFSFTSVIALMISGLVYLIYRKMFKLFGLFVVLSSAFIGFYHSAILSKLHVRFEVWLYTLNEIFHRPMGSGFDHSFNFNMIPSSVGLSYRHNDFLNITRDMGLPFLALIIFGLYSVLKNIKKDYLFWSILIILISCCVQTNMYFSRIAGIAIVLLAVKESQCVKV